MLNAASNILTENYCKEFISKDEKKLIEYAFSNNTTKTDIDLIVHDWNKYSCDDSKILLLLYLLKVCPDLFINTNLNSRLKEIYNKYRMNNLVIITPFIKAGKVLNENGIYPLILKGLAMKHLRQDMPRIMGDVDFLLQKRDFMKAIDLIVPLGYYYEKIDYHSVDLHDKNTGRNAIDIHRFISMGTKNEQNFLNDLFKRATIKNVFGVKSLVPCFEDLMFITLVNLSRNLRESTSKSAILYSLFDCKYFLESKTDFDWSIIKYNIKKTSTESHIKSAIKFINNISKNILPDNIFDIIELNSMDETYFTKVLFKHYYLNELRKKCRALKLKDLLKDRNQIINYLKLKPKYQFLKTISRYPKLINLFIKDLKNKKYDI